MIAATPPAATVPPATVRGVTAAVAEEPFVPEPEEDPYDLPPLTLTGDDETDEALAMLRASTQAIHDAQDRVAELSDERKRLVLALRRRTPPVLFRTIADAAGSTDQTIYKIHRDALQDERDRADAAEADRLGYPTLDAFREAQAQALVDDLPEVPPYVVSEPEPLDIVGDEEPDDDDRTPEDP